MKIYISGIHTDAGKTHCSAALCANFGFDYFKLIQAGEPTDSDFIRKLCPKTRIFKEGMLLKTPASPHLGRKKENLNYKAFDIALPKSEHLLIESAGGLFTPLDDEKTVIDYMARFKHPTFLVAKYYLGSINHILLSIEALKQRNIEILALVMMGEKDLLQDEFIQNYTKVKITNLPFFTAQNLLAQSKIFKEEVEKILT
ncbi:ATP-dependent dethiobiotin synthetase BioD [Campylobacter sp. US33a]|uniref:ATP-dependent dethiobiotin synthetase BioD n=1 Tax=Campylobacter sp. US33a TaxID=2498120 RepID=UPI0010678B15|nr:ATP-dependent dethiobiotin synthetase BioD [Campylobacter sp. US33a]TEY04594.1 ATP-dependent dethiobiotin synthetase BioD [Campylobacter sp. US33a]